MVLTLNTPEKPLVSTIEYLDNREHVGEVEALDLVGLYWVGAFHLKQSKLL